jgi:hypothetical protein
MSFREKDMPDVALFPLPEPDNRSPKSIKLRLAANTLVRYQATLDQLILAERKIRLNIGVCSSREVIDDLKKDLTRLEIEAQQYMSAIGQCEAEILSLCYQPCKFLARFENSTWVIDVGQHAVQYNPLCSLDHAVGWVSEPWGQAA